MGFKGSHFINLGGFFCLKKHGVFNIDLMIYMLKLSTTHIGSGKDIKITVKKNKRIKIGNKISVKWLQVNF